MKDSTRKDKQNSNQTPIPVYRSYDDDKISELVRKVANEMCSTNTPILSHESSDSPVWTKLLFNQVEI